MVLMRWRVGGIGLRTTAMTMTAMGLSLCMLGCEANPGGPSAPLPHEIPKGAAKTPPSMAPGVLKKKAEGYPEDLLKTMDFGDDDKKSTDGKSKDTKTDTKTKTEKSDKPEQSKPAEEKAVTPKSDTP